MKKLLLFYIPAFFICVFFSQVPIYVYAQGEANNWYFGSFAGITFNTIPPTALTNGMLNTAEGCAAISDASGNLLFYTDGIRVWNRNHIQMPNGFGLMGHPSSAQSGIIIPKPGSTTNYIIITVPEAGAVGMRFSEVDMTLAGGLGDVLPGNKNTLMFAPSSEKVTAVRHANGLYFWVIGRENGGSHVYKAFLIDCNGVNTTPVTSTVGVTGGENWGYMVAAPDGSKLASASTTSGVELTDFNNATGVVSNPVFLGSLNYMGYGTGNYGVAFSPNSQVLYATSIHNWALVQWDLTAPSIPATEQLITYTGGSAVNRPTYRGGALQLAPDGKIYVPDLYTPSLSAINNPNVIGPGCNFQSGVINLLGRNSQLGLPPFIQSFFDPNYGINFTYPCLLDSVHFSVIGSPSLDSVLWDFADPVLGVATSNQLTPSHVFTTPGTYNVRLIRYLACIADTIFQPVQVLPLPEGNRTVNICEGSGYILPGGTTVSLPGLYTDTINNASFRGCDSIVHITITNPPGISAGNDTIVCIGNTAQLNATTASPVMAYSWAPAASLNNPAIPNPVASPSTTTSYTVSATVSTGTNLVNNGDFEAGNTGFGSDYVFMPSGTFSQGHYVITNTPNAYNGGFSNCADHTPSATGNMMLVDGACGTNGVPAGVNIWCQTIAVSPNTDYEFSTWFASMVNSAAVPSLSFSINGVPVAPPISASNIACDWNQFFVTWNSGANTTAMICISEGTGVCADNDFALDDISFSAICILKDTVTVRVSDPQFYFSDSTEVVCFGGNTGAATVTTTSGIIPFTYLWSDGQADSAAINLPAGMHHILVTDSAGCTANDSILITEPPLLNADITSFTDVLCNGGNTGTAVVTASGGTPGYTYVWSPGGGTVSNPTDLEAGMHTVTVKDTNNCVATDSVMISELSPVAVTLTTPDDELCLGDQTTLTAAGSGGTGTYTYTWSAGLPGNTSHNVSPASSITYTVTCTDTNNCADTATLYILVSPLPNLSFTAAPVCLNNPTLFNNTSTVASGTITGYNWDMGDLSAIITTTNPQHAYATDGIFQVELSAVTDMGCRDTIWQNVEVYALPVAAFTADDPDGCTEHCVNFTDQSTVAGAGIATWNWLADGSSFSNQANPTHCFDVVGFHDIVLMVTSTEGCADTLSVNDYIEVYPLPVADFTISNNEIPLSDPIVVLTDASTNAITWEWNLGDGHTALGNLVQYTYGDSGQFCIELLVTSPDGCTDTDKECIYVIDDLTLFIPNTFTPNADNINDIFNVVGRGIQTMEMIIYDRWGEQIYYTSDKAAGWNGFYKGNFVKQDVYVYKIIVTDTRGDEKVLMGQVNVLY